MCLLACTSCFKVKDTVVALINGIECGDLLGQMVGAQGVFQMVMSYTGGVCLAVPA